MDERTGIATDPRRAVTDRRTTGRPPWLRLVGEEEPASAEDVLREECATFAANVQRRLASEVTPTDPSLSRVRCLAEQLRRWATEAAFP